MTDTITVEPSTWQREGSPEPPPSALFLNETSIWLSTQRASRRIYGDLGDEGIAVEWHNFELNAGNRLEWPSRSYSNTLELCLNLAGHGSIQSAESRVNFEPRTAFIYVPGNRELQACRRLGERHRFLTINFSSSFLRDQLMVCEAALHPLVKEFVPSGRPRSSPGKPVQLTAEHEQLISLLLRPQCDEGACQLRCKGIVLQLMADFLVKPCCGGGSSCDRQKCLARERVRGVVAILQRDLAAPPTLEAIGHEVGCSPYYLSRTFSREMGMTIPQCLRTLRMRYAAELLKSGKCNVTEAAMEVGYSSLSHFSQAFCQAVGCCPAAYSSQTQPQASATCPMLCSTAGQQGRNPDQQPGSGSDSQIDVLLESLR
jgi:AraC-like DNA-binding protein